MIDDFKKSDLTIIIPSYNCGKFIRETLDSIFAQKTKYTFNVIIADDASTDNTLNIIDEYQHKFKDKISILPSKNNAGLFKNIFRVYKMLETEYYTVLDPDDYWTDTALIDKALNFLKTHNEYTIYSANINMLNKNTSNSFVKLSPTIKTVDSNFNDYLNYKAVLSCTQATFYRNGFDKHILDKMLMTDESMAKTSFRGDSFRNIIGIHAGKAHFVNEISAVYRITDTGIWQRATDFERNNLNAIFFVTMYDFFDEKYNQLLYFAYRLFLKNQRMIFTQINYKKYIFCFDETNLERHFFLTNFFLKHSPVAFAELQKNYISRKANYLVKFFHFIEHQIIKRNLF